MLIYSKEDTTSGTAAVIIITADYLLIIQIILLDPSGFSTKETDELDGGVIEILPLHHDKLLLPQIIWFTILRMKAFPGTSIWAFPTITVLIPMVRRFIWDPDR